MSTRRPGGELAAARCGVAFFTPACVLAGRVGDGIALARAAGLRVRHVARVLLDEAAVLRIWQPQAAGFTAQRWAVATALFCAGPGVVVVVDGDPSGGEPVAARLKHLQGPSSPGRQTRGQWRDALGAVDKINNLVHVPDGPEAVGRELPLLLGDDGARYAWRTFAADTTVADPEREVTRQVGTPGDLAAGLGTVTERLRWRCLLHARLTSARPPADPLVAELARRVEFVGALGERGWHATQRWRREVGAADVGDRFATWLGASSPTVAAVRLLDDLQAGRPVEIDALAPTLRRAGTAPDRWELLVVSTAVVAQQVER